MNNLFTTSAIEFVGLSFYQLSLVFLLPFLLVLGIYEIYTLVKAKESNKRF
jgi:hypothetical protein